VFEPMHDSSPVEGAISSALEKLVLLAVHWAAVTESRDGNLRQRDTPGDTGLYAR
jgi:hypothetical protein